MASNSNPSSFTFTVAIVDKNGIPTFQFTKALQDWNTRITKSLNQLGELIGAISANSVITGRTEGIGTTVGNINSTGVITPPGLIPATDSEQGAVILPSGATSNVLGTASQSNTTDFDPAGAASTAQANAKTYTDSSSAATLSAAQSFASNASNITNGTLETARLAGITGSVTLAALTTLGTQGSITFQNGLITAVVAPT